MSKKRTKRPVTKVANASLTKEKVYDPLGVPTAKPILPGSLAAIADPLSELDRLEAVNDLRSLQDHLRPVNAMQESLSSLRAMEDHFRPVNAMQESLSSLRAMEDHLRPVQATQNITSSLYAGHLTSLLDGFIDRDRVSWFDALSGTAGSSSFAAWSGQNILGGPLDALIRAKGLGSLAEWRGDIGHDGSLDALMRAKGVGSLAEWRYQKSAAQDAFERSLNHASSLLGQTAGFGPAQRSLLKNLENLGKIDGFSIESFEQSWTTAAKAVSEFSEKGKRRRNTVDAIIRAASVVPIGADSALKLISISPNIVTTEHLLDSVAQLDRRTNAIVKAIVKHAALSHEDGGDAGPAIANVVQVEQDDIFAHGSRDRAALQDIGEYTRRLYRLVSHINEVATQITGECVFLWRSVQVAFGRLIHLVADDISQTSTLVDGVLLILRDNSCDVSPDISVKLEALCCALSRCRDFVSAAGNSQTDAGKLVEIFQANYPRRFVGGERVSSAFLRFHIVVVTAVVDVLDTVGLEYGEKLLSAKSATRASSGRRLSVNSSNDQLAAAESNRVGSVAQPERTRRRPLRILHISDLHERAPFEGMPGSRGPVLEMDAEERGMVLGDRFSKALAGLGAIDVVCLTGDVADWGHPNEYDAASRRLSALLDVVGVPKERFFAVPGNHDVQRRVGEDAWRGLRAWHARAQNAGALGRWFRDVVEAPPGVTPEWRENVLERTAAFWSWIASFGRGDLVPQPPKRLGYRHTIPGGAIDGINVPIHIIGLDSAWLCGDDGDQGKILVTEQQVQAHILDGGRPLTGYRIALVHHPLDHLSDHTGVRHLLGDNGVDLLLHGHQHVPLSLAVQEPGANLRIVAAGCLMEGDLGRDWPNGFQVIELDIPKQSGRIHFHKWAQARRFWAKGSDIYEDAPDGVLEF